MRINDFLTDDKSPEEEISWLAQNGCILINNHVVKLEVVQKLGRDEVIKQLNKLIAKRVTEKLKEAADAIHKMNEAARGQS